MPSVKVRVSVLGPGVVVRVSEHALVVQGVLELVYDGTLAPTGVMVTAIWVFAVETYCSRRCMRLWISDVGAGVACGSGKVICTGTGWALTGGCGARVGAMSTPGSLLLAFGVGATGMKLSVLPDPKEGPPPPRRGTVSPAAKASEHANERYRLSGALGEREDGAR